MTSGDSTGSTPVDEMYRNKQPVCLTFTSDYYTLPIICSQLLLFQLLVGSISVVFHVSNCAMPDVFLVNN